MFGTLLIFLAVLSVLVLIHELGHYIACVKNGVWVEEFGFGLPPRVWGKKVGETIWSINALPFGGFVRPHGETADEGVTDSKRALFNKSKKVRALVAVAGVVMNFVLAIAVFAIGYTITGVPRESENVKILAISESSPAQNTELSVGDTVREVEGQKITSVTGFIEAIDAKKGQETTILVEEDGVASEVIVTPRLDPPEGEGALGVVISATETYFAPIWQRPFLGIYHGLKEAMFWGKIVLTGFGTMIGRLFQGNVPQDIAGPVGIYALTSQAASFGYLALLNFLGVLSVNLAILNILPFPALDGGRLLFIAIETITKKRVMPRTEAIVHTVGMLILLTLIVAVTAFDIRRLITAGGVAGFLDSLMQSAQ